MTVPATLENNLILAYKGYFGRTSSQGNNVVSHRHDSRGEQHKVPIASLLYLSPSCIYQSAQTL